MKLPLVLEGHTVRDAQGRVIISALNPCTDAERRQIVNAVNRTIKHSNVLTFEQFDEVTQNV